MKFFASYFFRFRSIPLTSLVFVLYLFSFCFIPLATHAYFQSWGLSARGASWGGAGSAWGTDALDFLSVNPAAMGRLRTLRVEGDAAVWGVGWSDESSLVENGLRMGLPLGPGSLAASWRSRGLPSLFMEENLGLALAWPTGWDGVEFIGLGIQSYRAGFQDVWSMRTNPGITSLDARATSWDAGLRGWFLEGFSYALGVSNLTQPSLSVTGEEVRQPLTTRVGLGWRVDREWRIGVDPEWRGLTGLLRGGVEYQAPDDAFSARMGAVGSWGGGLSFQWVSWHAGGSARMNVGWGELTLHYGWTYPFTGIGGWGTHRFGLSVKEAEPSHVVSVAPVNTFAGHLTALPDPPWFFTALKRPREEWEIGHAEILAADMTQRHRHAALTVLVAGVTAGEQAYQALIGATATPFDGAVMRAIRYLRYRKPDEGVVGLIEAYREAARLPEPPPDVHLILGYVLALRGDWEASLKAYRLWWSTLEGGNADPGAAYVMATVALKIPDPLAAEIAIAPLMAGHAREAWVKELRGRVLLRQGRLEEALIVFEEQEAAAGSVDERARAKVHQAVTWSGLHREGAYEEAMKRLEAAEALVEGAPWVSETRRLLINEVVKNGMEEGTALEERLLMKEAFGAYERVLRWKPGHEPAVIRASRAKEKIEDQVRAYVLRARELMEQRDLERAIGEWKLVLDADASHAEALEQFHAIFKALIIKSDGLIREGAHGEAMRVFQSLEGVRPHDPEIQKGRQQVRAFFADQAAQHEAVEAIGKARAVWNRYLGIQPDDASAKAEIQRLVEDGRRRVAAHLTEAELLETKDDIGIALLVAEKALQVEPDSPEAQRALDRLRQRKVVVLREWSDRAKRALQNGEEKVVREWVAKILKVEPQHPEAKQWLAEIASHLSRRETQWFRAAEDADARLDPQESLKVLVQLLAAFPDHQGGVELKKKIQGRLERAKQRREEIQAAHLKGDIAYGAGQIQEAVALWEQALEWDYYNKEIRGKVDGAKKELKRP